MFLALLESREAIRVASRERLHGRELVRKGIAASRELSTPLAQIHKVRTFLLSLRLVGSFELRFLLGLRAHELLGCRTRGLELILHLHQAFFQDRQRLLGSLFARMRKRRKTRLEARLGLGEFEVELHDMLLQLMLLLRERVNCIAHARNLRPELTLAFCIRGACPLVGGKLVKRAANLIKLHTQRMLEIVGVSPRDALTRAASASRPACT